MRFMRRKALNEDATPAAVGVERSVRESVEEKVRDREVCLKKCSPAADTL